MKYDYEPDAREASIVAAVKVGLQKQLKTYPREWVKAFGKLCQRHDVMLTGSFPRHCYLHPGEPFKGGDLDFLFLGDHADVADSLFDLFALKAVSEPSFYTATSKAWDISPREDKDPQGNPYLPVQLFSTGGCWGDNQHLEGFDRYKNYVTFSIDAVLVGVGRAKGDFWLGDTTYADWHSHMVQYQSSPIHEEWSRRRAVRYALAGYNLGRDLRYDLASYVEEKGITALFLEYQGSRKPHEPSCVAKDLEDLIFGVR